MAFSLDGESFMDLFNDSSFGNSTDYTGLADFAPCKKAWSLDKYFAVVIYSTVCILSVIGNSLVLVVICYNNVHKSTTDLYLLNLAIADLLFAITLPFWAVYNVDQWIFGHFMCKIISVLQEVNFYSGILLLACISVDRYFAIVQATKSQKQQWVKYICLIVWSMAVLLSLPILLYRSVFKYNHEDRLMCYEDIGAKSTDIGRIIIRFSRHIIGFFIPLGVMLFCYTRTLITLIQVQGTQKHKAMRVVFAVVLAFLICWLPYNITVFADTLMRTDAVNETCDMRIQIDTALPITQLLGFTHSCINPILYAFIGQKFRRNFLKILLTHGIINRDFVTKYGRSLSYTSTSGNSAAL
ncbi:C-X-C chemokine receptor type 2-like [Protopterus annectens]|uniref:C-X-C chemokine receptor type 2-like n=1 Tax=Protopterus annectens TaxID=7888 RepID=UPI001CFC262F|nr:C-X-C chemokine receptor type 2-like [Protopterus annectens]